MDNKNEVVHTAEEFAVAYGKLCEEYGFTIKPELIFKPQIDGTFTIGVRLQVIKYLDKEIKHD